MANEHLKVIAGIDTHADTHHVAIITETGAHVADQEFLAVSSGYRKIIEFITGFGPIIAAGVEGTGSYGAELARVLRKEGIQVLEVMRPNRQRRRLKGKSDPLDAYQAAESVLAGRGTATPKARDGAVESLRVLRAEKSTAMRARVAVMTQVKSILVSAPESQRAKYRGLGSTAMMAALEKTRPAGSMYDPSNATAIVLKRLAVRYRQLQQELALIDTELDAIITIHAPLLRDLHAVGTDVASQLLVTVGDNPERIGTEAQFAALVGVAPIPASSGKTTRHRLSRGGDRQANKAIHHVALVRMMSDTRTKTYVARRRQEGKNTKEIMRCLKRYIAREIYGQLLHPQPAPAAGELRALRKAQNITLQAAADALQIWPATLSRLERGLTRDDVLYQRYAGWLNAH
ncbi:IS110 family transposase [Arthrobacter sp. NicSoilC12]|uniref:IS110 family transposase n=1 Tax=Arthrobacter sp. NicSoilC12 TaxID=2831001 RepID=UPI001CC73E5C|nr:IS110 family transposase [Arthrobacter sp. NicSoilC12]GIU57289.1 IS110 family transposase [Arthrobacter sp. NicSoilC12]GIU57462.1 IS110 family transposase [Arthrobacter sp. NicSoilC12]GIU57721.1 IS110 family transposase [Arthrobacter sp. NicSoilC12]